MDPDEFNLDMDIGAGDSSSEFEASPTDKAKAREDSLSKLEKSSPGTPTTPLENGKAKAPDVDGKTEPSTPTAPRNPKRLAAEKEIGNEREKRPDAIIVLREEKVRAPTIRKPAVHA